jgi:hypothetical protein
MIYQKTRKTLELYREQLGSTSSLWQLELLKGLPFYSDWQGVTSDSKRDAASNYQHLATDFNHAIGLPEKNGQAFPLFDYEQMLFNVLQEHKHVWIKKATGLGVTEFMLRYMAWLCLATPKKGKELSYTSADRITEKGPKLADAYANLKGSQMCIVTGPRIELAITLIDRMKGLFRGETHLTNSSSNGKVLLQDFTTKETVIELNGVHIEAYPSHHLDAMRGLKDVSFIYLDEADFFPPGQQQDARDVSERYIGKSNPWIVMVSTPNAPEGLFERIEKEPESSCPYKRLFLDYTYGLGRIYADDEIAAAKVSPSFEREYNLKYLGLIGNVFHVKDIEAAIEKGKKLIRFDANVSTNSNSYTQKSVGLDPGFGSSNFGMCITELVDGQINVVHAEEYQRPDFNEMINTTMRLLDQYNITFNNSCRVYIDGANPSFIRALKDTCDEDPDYERLIMRYKQNTSQPSSFVDLSWLERQWFILPVPFNKEHKHMLAHCKEMLEYHDGSVAINPKHNKLITSLRTAVENGEGMLDKDATSHDDLFDAFRLSLMFWH